MTCGGRIAVGCKLGPAASANRCFSGARVVGVVDPPWGWLEVYRPPPADFGLLPGMPEWRSRIGPLSRLCDFPRRFKSHPRPIRQVVGPPWREGMRPERSAELLSPQSSRETVFTTHLVGQHGVPGEGGRSRALRLPLRAGWKGCCVILTGFLRGSSPAHGNLSGRPAVARVHSQPT